MLSICLHVLEYQTYHHFLTTLIGYCKCLHVHKQLQVDHIRKSDISPQQAYLAPPLRGVLVWKENVAVVTIAVAGRD